MSDVTWRVATYDQKVEMIADAWSAEAALLYTPLDAWPCPVIRTQVQDMLRRDLNFWSAP